MVQTALLEDPFSGHVFVFRGRRGDLIKLLWWSGDGLCLFAKRLERGKFFWAQATSGTVALTQAQLSMLLEGIDWRRPVRSYQARMAVYGARRSRPAGKDTVAFLMAHGADLTIRDAKFHSTEEWAAEGGHDEIRDLPQCYR